MADRVGDPPFPLARSGTDFYPSSMRPFALLLVAVLGCNGEPSVAPQAKESPPKESIARPETAGPQAQPQPDDVTGEVFGGRRGNDFSYKFPRRQHPNDPVENPTLPPVLIRKIEPEYTEEAKQARTGGIVILEIVIEPDGRVSGGRVLKPLPMGLTQKAIDAVKQWEYEPAVHQGLPVRSKTTVSVAFSTTRSR
jgi:TonB family protein